MKSENPKKGNKLIVWFEEPEFQLLLQHTVSKHHRLAFLFYYASGMRISEAVNLQKKDFDWDNRLIKIVDGKGGKDRMTIIPIGMHPHHMNMIPLQCGVRAIQQAFYDALKRSGLDKIKPELHVHSLRHGFATRWACDLNFPLGELQQLLGHGDVGTTSIYIHAKPKTAEARYREGF